MYERSVAALTQPQSPDAADRLAPIHPGEILLKKFMEPLGISQNGLATAIGVPPRGINAIVHGKRRVTADTALWLGRYLGTSAQMWVNLQSRYDLESARDRLDGELSRITPLALVAA